jgi:hypothetical protein
MLGMLRLSGSKEEQARHAQLSHNVPQLIVLRKFHCHTLAVALDSLKGGTDIPRKRAPAIPDDVTSSNPPVGESGAEKART